MVHSWSTLIPKAARLELPCRDAPIPICTLLVELWHRMWGGTGWKQGLGRDLFCPHHCVKTELCWWASETLWVEKFSLVCLNIWYLVFFCPHFQFTKRIATGYFQPFLRGDNLLLEAFSICAASYDWLLLTEVCRHLLCLLLLTVLNNLPIHTH